MVRKLVGALAVACAGAALAAGAVQAGLIGVNEDATKFADDGGASLFKQMQAIGLQQNVISAIWTSGRQLSNADVARIQKAVNAGKANGVKVVIAVYPASGPNARALAGDSGGFLDYLKQVVGTFHGSVKDYIVLNEPNRTIFSSPVDPALTAKVLADSYDAIKTIDASVNVIGLGLSPRGSGNGSSLFPVQFLAQLGAAYKALGRSAPLMDAISFHPYPFPEDKEPGKPSDWPTIGMADLARLKQAVSDAFAGTGQKTVEQGLPIHLDEVAYQVATDGKAGYTGSETVKLVSEADQAAYYARIVQQVACDPSIASLSFFHFVDETDRATFQSGFLDAALAPRPVGDAVKSALAATGGGSKCTGTPVSWKPLTGVAGFASGFAADGKTEIKTGKVFGFAPSAEEDASYSAALYAADAKGAPTGKPLQTVTGKIPAMLKSLAKFDLKGKSGSFAYTVTVTSATNPGRTETATSGAFTAGSGRPGTTTGAGGSTPGVPSLDGSPFSRPSIAPATGAGTAESRAGFRVGAQLNSTRGRWLRATSFALAWLRCGGTSLASCAPIPGATEARYTPVAADLGKRLALQVTASNATGRTAASSALSTPIAAAEAAPRSTVKPVLSSEQSRPSIVPPAGSTDEERSTYRIGVPLRTSRGAWENAERFAYAWLRCTSAAAKDCAVIPDATGAGYTPAGADLGKRLRFQVTASNAAGSTTASTAPTMPIAEKAAAAADSAKPQVQDGELNALPRISPAGPRQEDSAAPYGFVVGGQLRTTRGRWSGASSYAYAWQRCTGDASTCTDIPGATAAAYTVGAADAGKKLRVKVTASNGAGSTDAFSALTERIVAAAG